MTTSIGISGMALSVPRFCVNLDEWCQWFGDDFSKVRAVVGKSYRLPSPVQNVYTLAANAVMRLIEQYNLDPGRIGFLALGTESSTDNAAGAVIVRGMVDRALQRIGLSPMSRHCEVPEYKHACLGGIYAIKNAVRYLAHDGRDKLAIVVSGDIAKYKMGSSGEPTQGSGAVAMLMEAKAKLLSLDLTSGGKSSRYRGLDFRKPFSRYVSEAVRSGCEHISDFPLFNGQYSVACYVEAILTAIKDMFTSRRINDCGDYMRNLKTLFMHRPYKRLPEVAWAFAYLATLGTGSDSDRAELAGYCRSADVDLDAVLKELASAPDLFEDLDDKGFAEPYTLSKAVVRAFRKTDCYRNVIGNAMVLGGRDMENLGNLYTAALPAWLATGLSQALAEGRELAGEEMLLVGYGSGDAAEVIPVKVAPGWRKAAGQMKLAEAMENPVDLTREQYESLHKSEACVQGLDFTPVPGEFAVTHTGSNERESLQDAGIDYYHYVTGS